AQYTSQSGYLPLIALSAKWEQAFAESFVGQGDDRQLAMQPPRQSEFITLFRAQTPVLSQGEIHSRARLKTVSSI
ncbi:MAG: EscV/YscV/HrcV family type III secretion system export apparatus protein, partial [Pseudolabrys sp.]